MHFRELKIKMKTRRTVYLIVGIILVVLNVLTDIIAIADGEYERDFAFSVGYFLGSHILMLFGLILLRMAYMLNRKIRNMENKHLDKDIDTIGG